MRDTRGTPSTDRPEQAGDPAAAVRAQLRRVQAAFVATTAGDDVLTRTAQLLAGAADLLEPHQPAELPGLDEREQMLRTRTLVPSLDQERWDDDGLIAQVTFSRFYTGANGAVHGGAIPLLFDQLLGRTAGRGRPFARTVNLTVDYRRITPVGRPLRLTTRLERVDGRKRWATGTLHDGDDLTVEVRAMFVELRPGQQ